MHAHARARARTRVRMRPHDDSMNGIAPHEDDSTTKKSGTKQKSPLLSSCCVHVQLCCKKAWGICFCQYSDMCVDSKGDIPVLGRKAPQSEVRIDIYKGFTQREAVIVLMPWDRDRVCAERPHAGRGITHEEEAGEAGRVQPDRTTGRH